MKHVRYFYFEMLRNAGSRIERIYILLLFWKWWPEVPMTVVVGDLTSEGAMRSLEPNGWWSHAPSEQSHTRSQKQLVILITGHWGGCGGCGGVWNRWQVHRWGSIVQMNTGDFCSLTGSSLKHCNRGEEQNVKVNIGYYGASSYLPKSGISSENLGFLKLIFNENLWHILAFSDSLY